MTYRKACVTGGAGFIGSKLTRALLERGIEVNVIDDLSVGTASNVPSGARLIEGSILNDASVGEAVSGCDVVFHLAARVAIRSSFDFVVEDTSTNVVGTAALLRAVSRGNSVRRVVSTSSMAVYADSRIGTLTSEEHPTLPVSPYGASKLCSESLTHQMCSSAGIGSAVVRLFNTYGVGQKVSPYVGVVTIFTNKLISGQKPTIFDDGEQCRDFVHVNDIVQGFLCAMDSQDTGGTFNIGTGIATSVNRVYELVQRALDMNIPASHAPAVAGELRCCVADITRARKVLGYEPRYLLEDNIAEVVTGIVAASAASRTVAV